MIPGKNILFLFFALASLSVFVSLFPTDGFFSTLNIILGVTILCLLFLTNSSPFDLRQMFYVANFVFLVLAARIDMSEQVLYWGSSVSVFDSYYVSTTISILAIILFALCYELGKKNSISLSGNRLIQTVRVQIRCRVSILLGLSLLAFVIILIQNNWNWASLFWRSGIEDDIAFSSQSQRLIFGAFIKPIPSICLVIYLLYCKRSVAPLAVLLALAVIGNFPTGMARWQAAMLYGAIVIAMFPKYFESRFSLSLVQFLGLFLVFPLLDSFRYYRETLNFNLSVDWIYDGHMDSAQSFARVIEHEVVSYGVQLLGVIFFFIPRTVWPDKPIGSGHEMALELGLTWSNISMHFFGEGYINFGLFGVLFFASMLGYIFGRVDHAYWYGRSGLYGGVLYLFLVNWVFFFVRGDMMSSTAYMVGTSLSVAMVIGCCKTRYNSI